MLAHYRGLLAEIDRIAEALAARYDAHLECRPGCNSCCRHDLTVFEVEAASVRAAFLSLPEETKSVIVGQAEEVQARKALGQWHNCPFLVKERCSIYALRPVICRTQGFPLLIKTEDGTDAVDFCPVNFSAPGAYGELDPQFLLPLDFINMKLALANIAYCGTIGIPQAESGMRKAMSDIVLEILLERAV
jgi:uncharacterized protein